MKIKSWLIVSNLFLAFIIFQASTAHSASWSFNNPSGWRLYGTYPVNYGARIINYGSGGNKQGQTWIAKNASWGWSEMARYKDAYGNAGCHIRARVTSTNTAYLEAIEVDRWFLVTPRVHQTSRNRWQSLYSNTFWAATGHNELYIRWVQLPSSRGVENSRLTNLQLHCNAVT